MNLIFHFSALKFAKVPERSGMQVQQPWLDTLRCGHAFHGLTQGFVCANSAGKTANRPFNDLEANFEAWRVQELLLCFILFLPGLPKLWLRPRPDTPVGPLGWFRSRMLQTQRITVIANPIWMVNGLVWSSSFSGKTPKRTQHGKTFQSNRRPKTYKTMWTPLATSDVLLLGLKFGDRPCALSQSSFQQFSQVLGGLALPASRLTNSIEFCYRIFCRSC